MGHEKSVDEAWKNGVAKEKSAEAQEYDRQNQDQPVFDFRAYLTSLTMQALIFLGVIGNPMNDNKVEIDLDQARLLIDTLIMLRDKTQGNLSAEEENFLNTSIYELQVRFVEAAKADPSEPAEGRIIT